MAAAPAVLKGRDARGFASRWDDSANCGAGFSKSWNRIRTGSPFPVTKLFLKRKRLILLTTIDADLAVI